MRSNKRSRRVCESCMQHLETLQQKIQQLNQYLGHSCQMAKGMVDGTLGAMLEKRPHRGRDSGYGQRAFRYFHPPGPRPTIHNAREEVKSSGDVHPCKYEANILWCSMKDKGASGWFVAGDDALLAALMAFTGSYVVGEDQTSPDHEGEQPELTPVAGGLLSLDQLLEGGLVRSYVCTDGYGQKECLKPDPDHITVKGMRQHVEELLIGAGGVPGIVQKLGTQAGTLSQAEQYFLANAPGGIGTMIRNLSAVQPGTAQVFALQSAPYIALDMLYVMIEDLLNAAQISESGIPSAFVTHLNELLADASRNMHLQKIELRQTYGSQTELYTLYNQHPRSRSKSRIPTRPQPNRSHELDDAALMDFYIYTLGDAVFLREIFVAIGSIMGFGHDDAYNVAIKIALLIGVLITISKAVVSRWAGN